MADAKANNTKDSSPVIYGLLAEFEDVDSLLRACKHVRDAGYKRWDSYTPFPVHGLNAAMGLKETILPWIVFVCGVTGCLVGIGLTVFTMSNGNADLPYALQGYPMLISGKPYNSMFAYIPIIFELTILLSAFGAVFGMLGLNKLPRLHHPLFNSQRFRRVTTDRFFVAIESDDPSYNAQVTRQLLEKVGAVCVEEIEDTE